MFIVRSSTYVLILLLVMAVLLVAFQTTAQAQGYGGYHRYLGGWDSGWYANQFGWHGGHYGGWDYGLQYYWPPYWNRPWSGYQLSALYDCRYRSGWYDPFYGGLRVSGYYGGYFSDGYSGKPSFFGAIAYSPATGTYGFASGYRTRGDAQRAAMLDCGAEDAKILVWARNRWLALALGDKAGVYGWAWSGTRARARQLALEACQQQTGGCYIAVSVWAGN